MDCETAATVLQAHYRGRLARRLYLDRLLHQFEKDEALRRNKELLQVTEGDLLVDRYRLQQEIGDWETLSINKQRQLDAMATRIQRAWRAHTTTNRIEVDTHKQGHVSPSQAVYYYAQPNESTMDLNATDVAQSHDPELDVVLNSDSELEEFVDNGLPHSQISHPCVVAYHLKKNDPFDATQNSVTEKTDNISKTDFNGDYRRRLLNSQDFTFKPQKENNLPQDNCYLEAHKTEEMEISEMIFCTEITPFERSNHSRNCGELHWDYKQNNRLSPASYTSHNSKYRLCFTSDLSESSSEEQDQDVYKFALFPHGRSSPSSPYREHTHAEIPGNALSIQTPCISFERADHGKSTSETVSEAGKEILFTHSELMMQHTDVEHSWHKPTSFSDALSFSEEFEHTDYLLHPNSSGIDSLSNSLSTNEHNASSVYPLNANSGGRDDYKGAHSRLKFDHGTSPLHSMTTTELKNLYDLLKSRMESISKVLVELLVQREKLASENSLLHENIAQLARNTQILYSQCTSLLPSHYK